jgi:uncharacterized protein
MRDLETGSKWHAGELEVQRHAGVGHVSDEGIRDRIPDGLARFLLEQRLAAFGSVDADGNTWASIRAGAKGFLRALDPLTLEVEAEDVEGDPLLTNLRSNPLVGVVVLDPATRRRVRLNGRAEVLPGLFRVRVEQVYGNCPQYIQQRVVREEVDTGAGNRVEVGTEIKDKQREQIARADTFFIASAHTSGVDASHRGGNPGFIQMEGTRRLLIPDYSGNRMFNTLGNIALHPSVGLVFPDFESGTTLQLTGEAKIEWETDRTRFPGAQRLLVFEVEKVIETEIPQLRGYDFRSYSPVNPNL